MRRCFHGPVARRTNVRGHASPCHESSVYRHRSDIGSDRHSVTIATARQAPIDPHKDARPMSACRGPGTRGAARPDDVLRRLTGRLNKIEHKGRACREAKFADKQRFRRAGLEPFLAHLNDSVGRLSRNEPLYGPTREATARVVADRTPLLPTTCHLVNRLQRLHPTSSCPRKRASRAISNVPAALDPRVRGGDGLKCQHHTTRRA